MTGSTRHLHNGMSAVALSIAPLHGILTDQKAELSRSKLLLVVLCPLAPLKNLTAMASFCSLWSGFRARLISFETTRQTISNDLSFLRGD